MRSFLLLFDMHLHVIIVYYVMYKAKEETLWGKKHTHKRKHHMPKSKRAFLVTVYLSLDPHSIRKFSGS